MKNVWQPKRLLSAALAIVSGAAFAQMTAVEDEVLSNQTGQDGIHIALNVKAHIDAFEWIDNASTGTGGSGSQVVRYASKTSRLVAAPGSPGKVPRLSGPEQRSRR